MNKLVDKAKERLMTLPTITDEPVNKHIKSFLTGVCEDAEVKKGVCISTSMFVPEGSKNYVTQICVGHSTDDNKAILLNDLFKQIAKEVLDVGTVKLMEERALVAYEQKYGSSY